MFVFLNTNIPSEDSLRSRKWSTSFWNRSTVKYVSRSNSNCNRKIQSNSFYMSTFIKCICEKKWWQHREFIKAEIKVYKHYLLNKKHLVTVNITFAKRTLCKTSAVLFWPPSARFCQKNDIFTWIW